MKMKFVAAACLTMGLSVNMAQAASVAQLTTAYGDFQWEDDNGEMIVNNVGTDPNQLDVGDYLTGVIEITQIKQLISPFDSALFDGATNSHLSGVFTVEVVSKTQNALGQYDFGFAAVGGGLGTIVSFYEDDVDNLNLLACANDAACKAAVTDGTLVLELGFSGDVDEFWLATGLPTDNLAAVKAGSPASKFGFANFALGVTGVNTIGVFNESQDTSLVEPGAADGNNKVTWLNSTDILGGAASTAYQATSDADFVAQVPEPGTLALMGLGFLGLGRSMSRRSKTA